MAQTEWQENQESEENEVLPPLTPVFEMSAEELLKELCKLERRANT